MRVTRRDVGIFAIGLVLGLLLTGLTWETVTVKLPGDTAGGFLGDPLVAVEGGECALRVNRLTGAVTSLTSSRVCQAISGRGVKAR